MLTATPPILTFLSLTWPMTFALALLSPLINRIPLGWNHVTLLKILCQWLLAQVKFIPMFKVPTPWCPTELPLVFPSYVTCKLAPGRTSYPVLYIPHEPLIALSLPRSPLKPHSLFEAWPQG